MNSKPKKQNQQLKDLDISINEFGEIVRNKSTEELNKFLNRTVEDKKLNSKK